MRTLKEKEGELTARVRRASAGLDGSLVQRWNALTKQAAPLLSPPALAFALALGVSLFLAGFFQFLTGLYEGLPGLSLGQALLNAVLAVGLGVAIALRRRYERAHYMLMGASALVFLLSIGSMGAKLEYQRGLAGDPYYALPHQPAAYPKTATDVFLRTADGVRLAGTTLGGGHTRAVVIYPSWRTDRHAFSIVTMAEWLSNSEDVLVLDPRGQGESDGAKTPDGQDKYDVLAAVAYMKANGHEHVGVLAEQDGSYAAILAAGMHQGIDSVALLAPTDDWGGSLGQAGHLWDPHGLPGRLFWRVAAGLRLGGGVEGQRPIEAIRGVSPTPVLFFGSKTEVGSSVDQLHMAAGEPKSLMLLPGDAHPVSWAHYAEYFKAVEEWFEFSLKSEPDTAPAASDNADTDNSSAADTSQTP